MQQKQGNVHKGPPSGKNSLRIIVSLTTLLLFSMVGTAVLDTNPPTTNVSGAVEGGIYNKTVSLTLEATDDISGVNYTEYRICYNNADFSNVTNCANRTTYTVPFNVVNEGYRTVKYYSVDNAGNDESLKFFDFVIDKTEPVLTIPENITVEATGITNDIDIGIASVTDNMDQNPTITNNAPVTFPIGTTKVTWIGEDWANNVNNSYQYINVLRQTHPMILNFSAVPNTSIRGSNPTTIYADVYKGVNKTSKVLIGVMDNNNITGANMPVFEALAGTADGNYAITWDGKSSLVNGTLATVIHINCDTCPESSYVFGIYKKTETSNESEVYVWIDGGGNITNVTYGNYSLLSPKEVNIPVSGGMIRYMRLEWNGLDFAENYSDTPIPIYNVTGENAALNPTVVKNDIPEGHYNAFVRAEDTQANYSMLSKGIDTIIMVPTPTPPSGGSGGSSGTSSSGSSGGGGGGAGTAEPYSNILKYEVVDNDITTLPVIYKYGTLDLIYEIAVTGTQSNEATLRVELLKDISKLTNVSPPEKVYKNFNMWINSKRIKNIAIRYKVENSWLENNSLNQSDIKLYGWKAGQWIYLDTKVINKDGLDAYLESDSGGLNTFAIVGLKTESLPVEEGASVTMTTEPQPTKQEKSEKAKGFDVAIAILAIAVLYLYKRR